MLKPNTRTIFLTINHAINVRDILRGGILATLRKSGNRIVILTPAHRDPEFVKEFGSDNVTIEPMTGHQPRKLERAVNLWRIKLFPEMSDSIKILATPRRERSIGKKAVVFGAMAIKRLLGASRTKRLLMWGNMYLFPDRHHREVFERYRPDLVVLTEVFSMAPDSWILKRAVRQGVPTLWLVRSWDNLTTKGITPAPVDRMVVWSETMREEAVSLHDFAPDHVYVGGVAHLDVLADIDGTPTREEFFRRLGGDPKKKLITYAMAPLARTDEEFEVAVIEHLWRLAQDNAFAFPSQVLARVYPLRGYKIPSRLATLPGLLVDLPGRLSPVFTDRDITVDDLRHAAATLRYSDVVVNVASTINIEAAVCGTPAVCVAFDLDPAKSYYRSHIRYFDYTHHQKLRSTGGVRLARSMGELVEYINAYLQDRTLDREGRQRILDTLCYQVDGHAGERIGKYILQYLDEVTDRPHAVSGVRRRDPAEPEITRVGSD